MMAIRTLRIAFLGTLVLAALFPARNASAYSSKDFFVFNLLGYGGDDHNKLTANAITNVGSAYPDIQKFNSVILQAASNEGISGRGSHSDPVSNASYWLGNEDLWRKDLAKKYPLGQFQDVYQEIGFVVHMREDATVPAHLKVDNHGLPLNYVMSPNDPSSFSGNGHGDEFEKFASNNHDDSIPPDIATFDITLIDPKTGCNSKFWLGPGEAGNVPPTPLGAYGRQVNVPCASPFLTPRTANGQDWFADSNFSAALNPIALRIAHAQLFTARAAAEDELITRSKSFKPLASGLSITGAGAGGAPVIDVKNGSVIDFVADENRTQLLHVSIFVKETGQKIVTDNAVLKLSSFRSAGGISQQSALPGPITWDGFQVNAFATNDSDLTLLPWESEFQLTWKGNVVGTALADGNYTLCVVVTDDDGNPSASSPNACDLSSTMEIFSQPPPVRLTMVGTSDYDIVIDAVGDTTDTPPDLTPYGEMIFNTQDAVSGIASIAIAGPEDFRQDFNNSKAALVVPFSITKPGLYTYTVTTGAGTATRGQFRKYDFTIAIDRSASSARLGSPADGPLEFEVRIVPTVSDGVAIQSIAVFKTLANSETSQVYQGGGDAFTLSGLSGTGPNDASTAVHIVVGKDSQGNAVQTAFMVNTFDADVRFPLTGGQSTGIDISGDLGSGALYLKDDLSGFLPSGTATSLGVNLRTGIDAKGNQVFTPQPTTVGMVLLTPQAPDATRPLNNLPPGCTDCGIGLSTTYEASGAAAGVAKYQVLAPGSPFTLTQNNFPKVVQNLNTDLVWTVSMTSDQSGGISPRSDGTFLPVRFGLAEVISSPAAFVPSVSDDGNLFVHARFPFTILDAPAIAGVTQKEKIGQAYLIDPQLLFQTPAVVTLHFSTQAVSDQNVDPASLKLYAAPPKGQFSPLPAAIDTLNGVASVVLSQFQLDTVVGLFGDSLGPAPRTPANLRVTALSDSTIKLAWDAGGAPPDETFAVAFGKTNAACSIGPSTFTASFPVKATEALVTGLSRNQAYALTVCAWDYSGCAQTVAATTLSPGDPIADPPPYADCSHPIPTNFRVVGVSSAAIELAWDAHGNPPGAVYTVNYGPTVSACALGASSFTATFSSLGTDVVIANLAPDKAYAAQVCAAGRASCAPTVLAATLAPGAAFESPAPFSSCAPAAKLTFSGTADYDIVVDAAGDSTGDSPDLTPFGELTISVQDAVYGIASIDVAGPDRFNRLLGNVKTLVVENFNVTTPGLYTYTIVNGNGDTTRGQFVKYDFTIAVDKDHSSAYLGPGPPGPDPIFFFTLRVVPAATSGVSITSLCVYQSFDGAQVYCQNGGAPFTLQNLSGSSNPGVASNTYIVVGRDDQGNSVQQAILLTLFDDVVRVKLQGGQTTGVDISTNSTAGQLMWADASHTLFLASGTATSLPLDLRTGLDANGNVVFTPPGTSLGLVIFTPPAPSATAGPDPGRCPSCGPGMSATYQASGAAEAAVRYDFVSASPVAYQLAANTFPAVADTTKRLTWGVTLTSDGGQRLSPKIDGVTMPVRIGFPSVIQSPGTFIHSASADGLCTFDARVPVSIAPASAPPVIGKLPASGACLIDPTLVFPTPAVLRVSFSTRAVLDRGIDPRTLQLYAAAPGARLAPLAGALVDVVGGVASAVLPSFQLNTVVVVLGSPGSSAGNPPADPEVVAVSSAAIRLSWSQNGNPPEATFTVRYGQAASCADAAFTRSAVVSQAAPVVAGLASNQTYALQLCASSDSGCAQTLLATTLSPGSDFTSPAPFIDCSQPQTPPPSGPTDGLAIAADASGKLWEVAQSNGAFFLSRYSGASPDFSVALPDAQNDGNWSIELDTAGFAYAIGASSGAFTVGQDLSVFKVSSAGVLVSSIGFHGGVDGRAIGFDATGDVWIAGAVQSAQGLFALSLWKYCIHDNTLTQTATYARGNGLDGGFGVRIAGGAVWVAGYSQGQPLSAGVSLDLALWKFSADGKTLLAGPYLRPGYLTSLSGAINARLEASAGALSIAALKTGAAGETDLAFAQYDLSGRLLAERQWVGASNAAVNLGTIRLDGAGNAVVGGSLSTDPESLGVWTYSPAGGFVGARTQAGAPGGARGEAFVGSDLYFAVNNSSAPLKFAASGALAGTDSAIKPPDATPPSVSLSPQDNAVVATARPRILASYADADSGVDLSSVKLKLDDVLVSPQVFASSASFVPSAALAQGTHSVTAQVADNAGNQVSASATWLLDSLPPATTLLVNGTAAASSSVTAAAVSTFSLSAVDSGTGLARTLLSIDGAPQSVYSSPFGLTPGEHQLSFQSVDNAGNTEAPRTVAVIAIPPPAVAILSPAGPGFSQVVKGTVPVIGSVSGQSLRDWLLESAPGQGATMGFTQISSGALAVSSATLALWDATKLSGWRTLRLSALNAYGETAAVSEDLWLGDPSLLLSISGNLKLPMDVAVGSSGLIYVADTGNDRVEVFSPQGSLQATFGAEDKQDALRFKNPQAVATDVFGNVYVADTDDKRALKLSSLGQLMLELPIGGKTQGIAVDSKGYIYVSDTDNAQVLKFNPAGSKVLSFILPGGSPAQLALGPEGNLYAADQKKKQVDVFSSTGALIATLNPGLQRPYGVAVGSAATCTVVSDVALDKIFKLDPFGNPLLVFGGRETGLGGPRGLAIDSAGQLYFAERQKNRIVKAGPPAPGTAFAPIVNPAEREEQESAFVAADQGGQIKRPDGASIAIPPGALVNDEELSVSTPSARFAVEEKKKADKIEELGLISVSTGVFFGPEDVKLAKQATVAVPYDAAKTAALGVPELQLQLYWWNSAKQEWVWVPPRVNPATHTVSGATVHLGIFKAVIRKEDLNTAKPPADQQASDK